MTTNDGETSTHRRAAHFAPQGTAAAGYSAREALEGASSAPIDGDVASKMDLDGAPAVAPLPSVKRAEPARDRFEDAFQSELEPAGAAASASAPVGEGDEALVRHRHKRKRVPLATKVLIALLAIIGVSTAAFAWWIGGINSSMQMDESDRAQLDGVLAPAASAGSEQGDAFYTLILGSDARAGDEVSRSDVIMLARVDPKNADVALVSIPRDTMINSVSGTTEKINAEFNYGPAASVEAVSKFAGVKISHYVQVDFDGLKNVVDALGGVWVDVPENIQSGNGGQAFSAGEQLLDGEAALSYARERYNVSGGDFGRAQAQRQIVEAIVKQVLKASPTEVPGLVSNLAASITTDLSVADIASYALEFQGAGDGMNIYSCAVPSYSLEKGGVSYVATMLDEWRTMMQRVDAGLDPNDAAAAIPEAQANNSELGAATNSASPEDYRELAANAALTTNDVAAVG